MALDRPPSSLPASAGDAEEASRLAAARAMLRQIEAQPSEASRAPEADDADPWDVPAASRPPPFDPPPLEQEPSVAQPVVPPPAPPSHAIAASQPQASSTARIPDGAIVAANGQPFRDIDAAHFKAARLSEETGEDFEVRTVAPGAFVLVPPPSTPAFRAAPATAHDSAAMPPPSKLPRRPPASPTAAQAEQLTLDSFPDGHPARKYGLPLYKSILTQVKKPLRPAWRSQLPLLFVALLGVLLFLAPDAFVRLAVPPASADRLVSPAFVKGVGYMGLALALFMLGKAVYVWLNNRFYLTANYVKSEVGIVARRSAKLVYGTILAIDTHQTVLGRLLNFGTVELSCAGSDGNEILISNVYAPEIVQAVIEARMIEMRAGSTYR
jgi:hypothetical protein